MMANVPIRLQRLFSQVHMTLHEDQFHRRPRLKCFLLPIQSLHEPNMSSNTRVWSTTLWHLGHHVVLLGLSLFTFFFSKKFHDIRRRRRGPDNDDFLTSTGTSMALKNQPKDTNQAKLSSLFHRALSRNPSFRL